LTARPRGWLTRDSLNMLVDKTTRIRFVPVEIDFSNVINMNGLAEEEPSVNAAVPSTVLMSPGLHTATTRFMRIFLTYRNGIGRLEFSRQLY
jgi:hypothetical protein